MTTRFLKETAMKGTILVCLCALSIVLAGSVARADSTMTAATRDGAGQGFDISPTDGFWRFTVTAVTGKPSTLIVRIHNLDGTIIEFASGKPRLGETLVTFNPVPAGSYRLSSIIHGGPPHDGASVTVAVDTP